MRKPEKDLKGLRMSFWKTCMAEQFFGSLLLLTRLIRRLGDIFVSNEAGICLKFLSE